MDNMLLVYLNKDPRKIRAACWPTNKDPRKILENGKAPPCVHELTKILVGQVSERNPRPTHPGPRRKLFSASIALVSTILCMYRDDSERRVAPESVQGVCHTRAAHVTRVTVNEKVVNDERFCHRNVLAAVATRTEPVCFLV